MSIIPNFEESDLDNIKSYQYKNAKYTPIDGFFRKLTELTLPYVPKCLSPNMITLIGFIFDVLGVVCLDVMKEEDGTTSHYACLIYAIFAFIYVYMDMLDGKQARRLGCNSPLGQLFDHGCDSLNGSCLVIATMKAIGLQDKRKMALMLGCTGYVFLTFQIIEYYQGVLMFGTSFAGVTEVEVLVILMNLISFFKGVSFWSTSLHNYFSFIPEQYKLQDFGVAAVVVVMAGAITLKNIKILIQGSQLPENLKGRKNISRVDHVKRYTPIITIAVMLYYISTKDIIEKYYKSIFFIAALCISHYSIFVNIHHICKKELQCNFLGHIVLFVLCILVSFHVQIDDMLMCMFTVVEAVVYGCFIYQIMKVMSLTLNIDVFGTKFKEN